MFWKFCLVLMWRYIKISTKWLLGCLVWLHLSWGNLLLLSEGSSTFCGKVGSSTRSSLRRAPLPLPQWYIHHFWFSFPKCFSQKSLPCFTLLHALWIQTERHAVKQIRIWCKSASSCCSQWSCKILNPRRILPMNFLLKGAALVEWKSVLGRDVGRNSKLQISPKPWGVEPHRFWHLCSA